MMPAIRRGTTFGVMKRSFRFFATWVAVTGLLMGVAFGAGMARGKDAPADSGTGLTAQQVQQLLNGAATGGSGATQQQAPVGVLGGPAAGP
jgi:hypothetical protein